MLSELFVSPHPDHLVFDSAQDAEAAGLVVFPALLAPPRVLASLTDNTVVGHLHKRQLLTNDHVCCYEDLMEALTAARCVVSVEINGELWFALREGTEQEVARCAAVITAADTAAVNAIATRDFAKDSAIAQDPVRRAQFILENRRPPVTRVVEFASVADCPVPVRNFLDRVIEEVEMRMAVEASGLDCVDMASALIEAGAIVRVWFTDLERWGVADLSRPGGPMTEVWDKFAEFLATRVR